MNKEKFIIDTDPGLDDIIALIMALKSKSIIVRLITTIGGNVDVKYTTVNAKYVVDLLKKKIPIGMGVNAPLWGGKRLDASNFHGKYGAGKCKLNADLTEVGDAIEMMYSALKKEKLSIIALGPLTNIALLIERHPDIKSRIDKIYSMGCTYKGEGSHLGWGEFNYVWDPIAVMDVAQSGIPLILLPTEVARSLPISYDEMVKYARDDEIGNLVLKIFDGVSDVGGKSEFFVHDAYVIDFVLNPQNYIVKKSDIWINLDKNSDLFGLTKANIIPHGRYDIVVRTKVISKTNILKLIFQ